MGAWIETDYAIMLEEDWIVAPRVGAWIETNNGSIDTGFLKSHPVWVRGLKLNQTIRCAISQLVAPRVGAWIETDCQV